MTNALVLGGGACVWADIEAALALGEFALVVACNDIGAAWPGRLDAWVSLHGDKFGLWTERRARRDFEPAGRVYGHTLPRGGKLSNVTHTTDFRFPGQLATGSSGLFALKVALIDLGADRAVLCGVPMDSAQAHFFSTPDWRGAKSHRGGWGEALPQIKDRARSMSGWTSELLGKPSEEWLGE